MTEHPIVFDAEEVHAVLDGTKTQFRMVIKKLPVDAEGPFEPAMAPGIWDKLGMQAFKIDGKYKKFKCPYEVGDRLWVRETWKILGVNMSTFAQTHRRQTGVVQYRADEPKKIRGQHWSPSVHMPRWASRLTLEITDVRVEKDTDWMWVIEFKKI